MKKRTIVIVAFVAVITAGWLGMAIGVGLGTGYGRSDYHNQYVRELQIDLRDGAQSSDPHTQNVLQHVSDLVIMIGQPEKFLEAREIFAERIEDMRESPATE